MKTKIIAIHKNHLESLIKEEMTLNGFKCGLNHIDVSKITDMSSLFHHSKFNGDISGWDVSQVENMSCMFYRAAFNGDISKWNISNVTSMHSMFYGSLFNQDISQWNVSNVEDMRKLFEHSKFNGDITNWKPYNLKSNKYMFDDCPAIVPYWDNYEDIEARKKAIDIYHLNKELSHDLENNNILKKKIKI